MQDFAGAGAGSFCGCTELYCPTADSPDTEETWDSSADESSLGCFPRRGPFPGAGKRWRLCPHPSVENSLFVPTSYKDRFSILLVLVAPPKSHPQPLEQVALLVPSSSSFTTWLLVEQQHPSGRHVPGLPSEQGQRHGLISSVVAVESCWKHPAACSSEASTETSYKVVARFQAVAVQLVCSLGSTMTVFMGRSLLFAWGECKLVVR